MIDILLPLSLYFLLCLPNLDKSILKSWFAKALPVFSVGLTVEILQYLGIPIFGQTYDPIDFYMYAIGIILAALLDKQFFPHIFSFWNNHDEEIR
ncbi:MAG: hypothetical protein JXA13_00435 [Anaerolineales bacterium]|nr:hypothetical protein [Anaerolineales bacterium]